MRVYGEAGALVTARAGIEVPTRPSVRPSDWPPAPRRATTWTSPIPGPPEDDERALAATRTAERTAAATAALEARKRADRERAAAHRKAERKVTPAKAVRVPAPAAPRARPQKVDAVEAPRLYGEGWTTTRLAARYGVSPAAVGQRLRALGVEMRPGGGGARGHLREHLVPEITRMWTAGTGVDEICVALGISRATLSRAVRELGLPRRRQRLDGPEIVRLYADLQSVEAVAAVVGTSTAAVRYQLKKERAPVRQQGGARRSDEVRDQALAQYAAGTRLADIYSQFAITESTLGRWRRDAGIPNRP